MIRSFLPFFPAIDGWAHAELLWLLPLALLPLLQRPAAIQVPSLPQTRGRVAWWLVFPAILYVGALALLVFALAGPQRNVAPPLPRPRGHLILILDTSASMGGKMGDATRLENAASRLVSLLEKLPPLRVGIVRAASETSLALPLTQDPELISASLLDARVESDVRGATALGEAIAVALHHLPEGGPPGAILLVSDGRNNYGRLDLPTAGAAAAAVHVPVFVIGVGEPATAGSAAAPPLAESEADSLDVTGLTALCEQTGGHFARLRERERLAGPLQARFATGTNSAAPQADAPRRRPLQPEFLFASGLLFCLSLGLGWGPLRAFP